MEEFFVVNIRALSQNMIKEAIRLVVFPIYRAVSSKETLLG